MAALEQAVSTALAGPVAAAATYGQRPPVAAAATGGARRKREGVAQPDGASPRLSSPCHAGGRRVPRYGWDGQGAGRILLSERGSATARRARRLGGRKTALWAVVPRAGWHAGLGGLSRGAGPPPGPRRHPLAGRGGGGRAADPRAVSQPVKARGRAVDVRVGSRRGADQHSRGAATAADRVLAPAQFGDAEGGRQFGERLLTAVTT